MEDRMQQMLKELGKLIAESATSVLPMLIPKPVEVSPGRIQFWKPQAYPVPTALITTKYINGPKGSQYFLFTGEAAGIIVDLMLGGMGSPNRDLDKDGKEALKQLMNQLLGIISKQFKERYKARIEFEQVDVHTLEPGVDMNLLLGDDEIHKVDINIKIGEADVDPISTFIPMESLASLRKVLSGGAQALARQPAAAGRQAGGLDQAMPLSLGEGIDEDAGNVGLILDLELPVIIRLGSAEMTLQEILRLASGTVIELNKTVEEPVELLVNNKVIAKGEVVVVEGNFAFRVTEIESKSTRIKSLT
jgi:flagellar motor switch protein FliN/FliY